MRSSSPVCASRCAPAFIAATGSLMLLCSSPTPGTRDPLPAFARRSITLLTALSFIVTSDLRCYSQNQRWSLLRGRRILLATFCVLGRRVISQVTFILGLPDGRGGIYCSTTRSGRQWSYSPEARFVWLCEVGCLSDGGMSIYTSLFPVIGSGCSATPQTLVIPLSWNARKMGVARAFVLSCLDFCLHSPLLVILCHFLEYYYNFNVVLGCSV